MKNYVLILVLLAFVTSANAQDFWQPTNGPFGGRVNGIVVNHNGQIFAATRGGGVFRSIDNGDNWVAVNNGLTNLEVFALAINAEGHLFAGTLGDGVFRSTDNGKNWTQINSGLTNDKITCLNINTQGHIFAGSRTGSGGLFRSTNNGNNWTQIGFDEEDVFAIAFDENNDIFVTTVGSGVFFSSNNGDDWTAINNGLTDLVTLGIGFNSAGNIFIGTFDGIFRSIDNGSNWTQVDNNIVAFAFALNSSGELFAGSYKTGMFRSIDNGDTWTEINNGIEHFIIWCLAVNTSDNIFAGSSGGVYSSFDNGDHWQRKNNGIVSLQINSLVFNSSDWIFASDRNAGVFRSTDNGNSWLEINNGLTTTEIRSLCVNSFNHIFAGLNGGGACRSTDNGNTWTDISNGLPEDTDVGALCVNSNNDIFAGSDGIYRSTDNGDSWTTVNNGITGDDLNVVCFAINSNGDVFANTRAGVYRSANNGNSWIQIRDHEFDCMAINSSDHIYGGDLEGIHRSTDNGDSWTYLTGSPYTDCLAINSEDHIFAGNDSSGVYRSTDNGDTWIQINSGLTDTRVSSLAINSEDYIFTSITAGGVFRSVESTVTTERYFLTHETGELQVSVFGNGYIGLDRDKKGNGVLYAGNANALCCGSFMIGNNERIHGMPYNEPDEMISTVSLQSFTSDENFNQISYSVFNDSGAVDPFGVSIHQYTYSDSMNDFIYFFYQIINSSGRDIDGLFAGIFADWDIGDAGSNMGGYDISRQLVYEYQAGENISDSSYYGVIALTPMAGARVTASGEYSNNDSLFIWMNTFVNEPISSSGDYRTYMGCGPLNIENGEKNEIAFAFLAGDDLTDLQSKADLAIQGWNSGIVAVENKNNILNNYCLFQNYPNPFNPHTTIQYSIPHSGNVTLKIYDLLGREIETLINRYQRPNTYSVDFDASKFSSGVYFYQLQVGDVFVETKKMLFLK